MTLPPPIDRYFTGKNAGDLAAALAAFSASAVVQDEGSTHEGQSAILAWMEETHRKYRDRTEVEAVDRAGEGVLVTARVSGTFPGSPVTLHFRFSLEGDRISRLKIAA